MKQRTPWQRLFISLVGITILEAMWYLAVHELRLIQDPAIAAFTQITTSTIYGVVSIVIFLVTGKFVYDWKMSTTQTITETGEQLIKEIRTPAAKHFDGDDIP